MRRRAVMHSDCQFITGRGGWLRPAFCMIGLVIPLCFSSITLAASGTWTNAVSGGLWSDANNWGGGVMANGSGTTGDFSTVNITSDPTVVHLDGAYTVSRLFFDDADTNSPAGWVLDNNGNSANTLTLGSTPKITVNLLGAGRSVTISNVIAGTSGLTKLGAGTLVVAVSNMYTGTTTIGDGTGGGGTLQVNNPQGLGNGTSIAAYSGGGTSSVLDLRSDSNVTFGPTNGSVGYDLALQLEGSVMTINVDQLTPAGSNKVIRLGDLPNTGNFGHTYIVSGGHGYSLSLGTVDVAYARSTTMKPTTAGVTVTGDFVGHSVDSAGKYSDLYLDGTGSRNIINGNIQALVTKIIKQNTSVWTLFGANFTTNTSSVTGGVLVYAVTNAQPAATTIVSAGATLGLGVGGAGCFSSADVDSLFTNGFARVSMNAAANVGIDTTAGDFMYATSIPATNRGLVKTGINTLTLTGTNAYSGMTTVYGGSIVPGNNQALSTNILTLAGGGLSGSGGSMTISNNINLAGDGVVDTAGNGLVLAGAITNCGTLTKIGAGTLTLSTSNTYSGATTVGGGTLRLAGNSVISGSNNLILAGGTLDCDAYTNSFGTLSVASTSTLNIANGAIAFADSSAQSWTGAVLVTGSFGSKSIRFGTNDTALTAQQLKMILWQGVHVGVSSQGYLIKGSRGTVIAIR